MDCVRLCDGSMEQITVPFTILSDAISIRWSLALCDRLGWTEPKNNCQILGGILGWMMLVIISAMAEFNGGGGGGGRGTKGSCWAIWCSAVTDKATN